MRWAVILLAAFGLSGCDRKAENPQPKVEAELVALSYDGGDYKTKAAKVAHGKRLATVLNCTGCHGSNLQGANLADKPEDGAMYTPNITLLVAKYNDAELDRLIRHGEPKDGREFWFMPVESFQFLSDADTAAIIAYLRTFKAQGKQLPAFEFNRVEQKDVDQGLIANARAQIAKYRREPPVDLGPRYAWGRYIVQTTCTVCHNNALQGWENFAPDLDIAGSYSAEELTRLLTTGEGKVKKNLGPMSKMAREHFSHLTPAERAAVVAYIKARVDRPL